MVYSRVSRTDVSSFIKYEDVSNVELPDHSGISTYLDQIDFPSGSVRPDDEYENHLPLCRLDKELTETPVELVARKLYDLLSDEFTGTDTWTVSSVQLPLSELIDNVDQHSRCHNGAVLVQQYPNKDLLDICVADDGVSIPGNFADYGERFSSDSRALQKAVVEGYSTKNNGRERGHGLPTTTRVVCDGLDGEILLVSGDGALYRDGQEGDWKTADAFSWPGTVFVGRLYPPGEGFDVRSHIR